MATYLGTHGSKIQNYTTDPDNPNTGEVWYNDTANTLKFQYPNVSSAGSWRTGGNLNTARDGIGNAGSYTSALAFGGGAKVTITEKYDGTSWTEVNDLNTARRYMAGAGVDSTAALGYSGEAGPGVSALTESWNGTNWTETGDLNTARSQLASAGITTATIAFGGEPQRAITEQFNGTNWTEVADLNTGRQQLAGAAIGTSTSTLAFGGEKSGPARSADTELWNGTSWSEQNNLSTAREYLGGAGTATNALAFGGSVPPDSAATEEWTGAGAPVGSWSTGGDMVKGRYALAGASNQASTNSLAFGGNFPL